MTSPMLSDGNSIEPCHLEGVILVSGLKLELLQVEIEVHDAQIQPTGTPPLINI